MSTKTSFKRIAAVAAVAITLGGVSAVSAHAVVYSEAVSLSSASSSVTAGHDASVVVTDSFLATGVAHSDTNTVAAFLVSAPAGNLLYPAFSGIAAGTTDANATKFAAGQTATTDNTNPGPVAVVANYTLTFQPTVPGTYVVKLIPSAANSTSVTWTVTVAKKRATNASSTTYMIPAYSYYSNGPIDTAGGVYSGTINAVTDVASTNCYADPKYNGRQCAVIQVDLSNAQGALGNDLAGADNIDITASVSGPGLIGIAQSLNTPAAPASPYLEYGTYGVLGAGGKAIYTSSTVNYFQRGSLTKNFVVYQDGTTGTATVSFSVGGTVIGTKTVVFYGNPATIKTVSAGSPVIHIGADNAAAVTAYVVDSNGNPVPGVTLNALSSDATVIADSSATSDATGKVSFTLTGVALGTADLTITNASSLTDTTTTALAGVSKVSVRTGSKLADSVSWAFDADTYVPGGLATLSITLKDKAGLPVAPGTYTNIFAANPTFTLATFGGTAPTTSVVVPAGSSTGTATYSLNVSLASGDATLSAKTATTTQASYNGLVSANQGVAVSVKAAISGGAAAEAAQAATDAAQEATDAANAAYDAANNAMDSADAATAAAQDASDNASAALAAVTSLSATVAKLVSSVAALASALTAIKKKLGVK